MSRRIFSKGRLLGAAFVAAAGVTGGALIYMNTRKGVAIVPVDPEVNSVPLRPLPTRKELLDSLEKTQQFDVLVIGGGATGSGVALDAQSRGLNTALVELDDYSSGTSSRSTKLIHGGVRYLQAAFMKADLEQYRMVKEALFERANLLSVAPHLSFPLPIMLPVYRWWQVPYFWVGIKMYDFVAGDRLLKPSYFISKSKALELFPMLKSDSLVGALIYYDGQHNDARMNLSIALSAVRRGATCVNHAEVTSLIKEKNTIGKDVVKGAIIVDRITGKKIPVRAKCVINATGPFTDSIRRMDNQEIEKICIPSQGVHVVLPGYYSPVGTGLLDPSTKDGRVIFFLPWEKYTVAGTTDSQTEVTHNPAPLESEIQFILSEIRNYLSNDISVRRGDVMSAWAGLRPLVRDPNKTGTAGLARNHIIEVSPSKLITIAGGKWTTYRHMAEETVDRAIEVCALKPATRACLTAGLLLEGGQHWNELMYIRLVQDYGLDVDVASHLANTYGDKAFSVAKMATFTGMRWPIMGVKVHPEFPYLEAEVRYAIREYAQTVVDVIGRRFRLAFLNTFAAEEAIPRVVAIMAEELGWSRAEQKRQAAQAREFLNHEMGKSARQRAIESLSIELSPEERREAMAHFDLLDRNKKGFITINDLRQYYKEHGEKINEVLLHDLLNEIDLNKNGVVDTLEFLQIWTGLLQGKVSHSRFAAFISEMDAESSKESALIGHRISTRRSGGGV